MRASPPFCVGTDTGPNPAETLLHALAACLTTSLVYVASARGVRLTRVESTLEGDMDLRGALGLSDEVRNGFDALRVTFQVEGDASPEGAEQAGATSPAKVGRLRHGLAWRACLGDGKHDSDERKHGRWNR